MHNPKSRAFPKDRSSILEKAIAVSGVTLGSAVE